MDYLRVIILGETFRLNGGGGITMTNLFRDWPTSKIGVITDGIGETNPHTKYSYYQLGDEEIKFPFPFNFAQNHVRSGPYIFDSVSRSADSGVPGKGINSTIKKKIRRYFDMFLSRTGLVLFFYRINLSESLKRWILDFNPDLIYIQPFHARVMQFGNLLYSQLKIPYAVHIMDDSVKYINHSIILSKMFQRQIEANFKILISNASVRLCISEAMAEEYYSRYGKHFSSFRNPIDIENWMSHQKKELSVGSESLKIFYNGRLFSPTIFSLIDMCHVVNELNMKEKNVELHIYTHDTNPAFNKIIQYLKGVKICKTVTVGEIPRLIQQYDIFFLCLDFDMKAQKYSQFSISTRTSEGMISAVPILLYAPTNTAMFKYFDKYEAGCLVGERDSSKLEMAVMKLWNDTAYRSRISSNAVKAVMADSNSVKVREDFRNTLTIL
jgi:glycosyltransferase involved in cell wall biosynthesis